MNYVEPVHGEHAINIRVPMGDRESKCQLFGQDRFEVANRDQTSAGKLLDFPDVAVGDFPAANDAYIQGHFFSRPTPTAFIRVQWALMKGSRRDRMAIRAIQG
jgi:hypothetical protein